MMRISWWYLRTLFQALIQGFVVGGIHCAPRPEVPRWPTASQGPFMGHRTQNSRSCSSCPRVLPRYPMIVPKKFPMIAIQWHWGGSWHQPMDVVWPHGAPRRLENLNLSASEKAKLMQAMAAEGVGSSARCVKLNKILQRNLMKIQLIQLLIATVKTYINVLSCFLVRTYTNF